MTDPHVEAVRTKLLGPARAYLAASPSGSLCIWCIACGYVNVNSIHLQPMNDRCTNQLESGTPAECIAAFDKPTTPEI